jgi:hypothetical protein
MQQGDRRSTYGCAANYEQAVKPEVIAPNIIARMKESYQRVCVRIKAALIRPFVEVTPPAAVACVVKRK